MTTEGLNCRVSSGDCSPKAPSDRTCDFPASGSSNYGFAEGLSLMYHARRQGEALELVCKLIPGYPCSLGATAQPLTPYSSHFPPKAGQRLLITRYSVSGEVASHLPQQLMPSDPSYTRFDYRPHAKAHCRYRSQQVRLMGTRLSLIYSRSYLIATRLIHRDCGRANNFAHALHPINFLSQLW